MRLPHVFCRCRRRIFALTPVAAGLVLAHDTAMRMLIFFVSAGYQAGDCGYCKPEGQDTGRTPSSRSCSHLLSCCMHPHHFLALQSSSPDFSPLVSTTLLHAHCWDCDHCLTKTRRIILHSLEVTMFRPLPGAHGPGLEEIGQSTLSSGCESELLPSLYHKVRQLLKMRKQHGC